jgi:hypothetical protein
VRQASPTPAATDRLTVRQDDRGRRGANDYGRFFAGDPLLAGVYGGHDGPCHRDQRTVQDTAEARHILNPALRR